MSYAKTLAGARRRAAMKGALRRKGVSVPTDITNKKLEKLYRKHLKKAPPSYKKYKLKEDGLGIKWGVDKI